MRNKNIKNYHFCNFCTTYKNVKPDLSVYWIDRKLIGRFQKVGCVVSANSESDDIDMQIVQNKFHTYLCRYNWKVLSLKTLLPSFLCNCIPSTSTIYVRELSVFTPRANARALGLHPELEIVYSTNFPQSRDPGHPTSQEPHEDSHHPRSFIVIIYCYLPHSCAVATLINLNT